jgi:ubiquitin carboxyl-terminal hydrolase 1
VAFVVQFQYNCVVLHMRNHGLNKTFCFVYSSLFSVSKVNDFMPTPLNLACFCDSCCADKEREEEVAEVAPEATSSEQKFPVDSSAKHSYQLFAAIMHLGATMASGHYVSFVRASDNVPDYCECKIHQASRQSISSTPSTSSGGKIRNFFKPIKAEKPNHSSLGINICPGADCCGIRLAIEQGFDSAVPEPSWLECDDDTITVLTKTEFEDILSQKRSKYSSLTPYLLFYVRTP